MQIVPSFKKFSATFDEAHETPDSLIQKLLTNGQLPAPPPTPQGHVTIWKPLKQPKGNRALNTCFSEIRFIDNEDIFIVAVEP